MFHQGVDAYWPSNATQYPQGLITNSIYRASSYVPGPAAANDGDGIGTQLAADSFVLPEFSNARVTFSDRFISEFNIGYFYATNWLNYTHHYPAGTYNVWGRLAAAGSPFSQPARLAWSPAAWARSNNQLSRVTLGYFSDAAPSGFQTYHWVELTDTNNNPVSLSISNSVTTLRLTAPITSSSAGNSVNPLFFMLTPWRRRLLPRPLAYLPYVSGGNINISIPTQSGHRL